MELWLKTNKILRILLIWIFLAVFILNAHQSEAADAHIMKLGNEVIVRIFQDVYSLKNQYSELQNLTEKSVFVDNKGWYLLKYENFGFGNNLKNKKSYGINVRVQALENRSQEEINDNNFRFDYPLLGISLVGDQYLALKSKQLNILPIVEENQIVLENEQQSRLPFQLTISTAKESINENEDIEFVVSLQNVTDHNLKVKNLSSKTLSFIINKKEWGAEEVRGSAYTRGDYIILKSGEKISKFFRGKGLGRLSEFRVFCTYNMTYKSVNPQASLKVKIVNSLPPMKLQF